MDNTHTELYTKTAQRLTEIAAIECPFARSTALLVFGLFEMEVLALTSPTDVTEAESNLLQGQIDAIYTSVETEIAAGPTAGDSVATPEFAAV